MQNRPQPEITLEQIDRELADWQARLSLASSSLLELDDMPTYKRLQGDLDAPPVLLGVTQARVVPTLGAVARLWRYLQLLNDVLKQATELRAAMPRLFGSENVLHKISDLLHGQSISLPPIETPADQRGLLTASQTPQATSPELLLTAMTHVYDEVRNTILAVDAAWNRLEPALATANQDANQLRQLAEALGEGTLPEVAAVQSRIIQLQQAVASDPLGVTANFDRDILPLLQNARARLETISHQRRATETDLRRSRDLIFQLRDTHNQCEQALNHTREKIANPEGLRPPLDPNAIDDLEKWLGTLETNAQAGRWKAVRIGLDRWLPAANASLESERQALAANKAPTDAAAELRGRLSALRAKAQAMQARGQTLDAELPAIAREADARLQTVPTELAPVSRLVAEYESRLHRG